MKCLELRERIGAIPSTIYHLPSTHGALMDISLAPLINVYSLSTGRRLFALGQVMKVAKEQGYKDLAAHCDQGRSGGGSRIEYAPKRSSPPNGNAVCRAKESAALGCENGDA
ncbi:MAG: hypothetical protein IPK82_29550 [Polyangiaceae bacterium]|nr:hypothetical protein [Polyangiaceae bacterium]